MNDNIVAVLACSALIEEVLKFNLVSIFHSCNCYTVESLSRHWKITFAQLWYNS